MALEQLIYVSTATTLLDDDVLHAILESSVRHNTPQQVTGMLLYAEGSFMQVLEGTPEAVAETMSRIREDPRHYGIVVIDTRAVARREFGDWTMALQRASAVDLLSHGHKPLAEYGAWGTDPAAESSHARALLHSFIQSNS